MDEPLQLNVLGDPLEMCGTDPMTGFFRDGYTTTSAQDVGSHTVCAIVTAEFLEHQQAVGNDLSTPMPQYGFPGPPAEIPLGRMRGPLAAVVRGRRCCARAASGHQ